MISVDIAGHRFQLRAAAVVLHAGHVLLHRHEDDDFRALPGGRVEPGEDAASTVVREMREELGESIACDALLYLAENFFMQAGQTRPTCIHAPGRRKGSRQSPTIAGSSLRAHRATTPKENSRWPTPSHKRASC